MHATFVTLWLQVVQPLANVHETKWTPHVKRESDVAQSYNSSAQEIPHAQLGSSAPPGAAARGVAGMQISRTHT